MDRRPKGSSIRHPQTPDVDLHDVGVAFEVVLPDAIENFGFGQDLTGPPQEELEDVELTRRQLDLNVTPPCLSLPGSIRRSPASTGIGLRPVARRRRALIRATRTGNENGFVR